LQIYNYSLILQTVSTKIHLYEEFSTNLKAGFLILIPSKTHTVALAIVSSKTISKILLIAPSKTHSLFLRTFVKALSLFRNKSDMIVTFEKDYLSEMYKMGKTTDKKHRFQPEIIRKYTRIINLMIDQPDMVALAKYNSLNYEQLKGDKAGISSVRVNDQYRIEFIEKTTGDQTVAIICNIIELSNHYK
jgi:proteic killer suppression protein